MYADVETWPLPRGRIERFGAALYRIARDRGGDLLDAFYGSDYCAFQVSGSAALVQEIAALPEVARVSRPLQVRGGSLPGPDIRALGPVEGPDPGAPGILVVDSGIVRHPLLEPAIAGFVDTGGAGAYDDDGHGTRVAGVAAYGDVQACVDGRAFRPRVRLYSAKVMKRGPDGGAVFDGLIDGKIERAVGEIAERHPTCRIVNLSLGDSGQTVAPRMPQLRLASLIDRLSASHKRLMFVVSAGNIEEDAGGPYPDYLLGGASATSLIDPATSAHAITVGSLFRRNVDLGRQDHPSPGTRAGPGLAGMVKPDVVEYGGGYAGSDSHHVLTMNMSWAQDGRLFTLDSGTSMSAPKVAHALALLRGARPGASRNLLKALLVSSAEIPALRPPPLDSLSPRDDGELAHLLRIYGHGKPDPDRAMHSSPGRALFVHDGSLRLDHADLFAVRVPDVFTATRGRKEIAVTLAFDPPTDGRRRPYLGVAMRYHLYKNTDLDTVRRCYERVGGQARKDAPKAGSLKGNLVNLLPGPGRRMLGAHQKAWAASPRGMGIDTSRPLVLVVIAEKKWVEDTDYSQDYAVAVAFGHSSRVDIYSALRSANQARVRAGGGPR